jgi:hypothetical protein
MVKSQNIGKPQVLKGYHSVALFSIMIEIKFEIKQKLVRPYEKHIDIPILFG